MASVAQTPVLCELCSSNEDVKFFCVDCQEILCARCKVVHSKSRKTKNDEIISISDVRFKKRMVSAVTMCNEHPVEELSLFCFHCERFICTECVDETHEGHKVVSSKKVKKKQEELVDFKEKLENKQAVLKKALDTENNVYTKNTKWYDNLKQEMSNHVTKIIEEVTTLKDEKFSEIYSLQRAENQRHTDACDNIQSQTQALTTAIQFVQTAIDSGMPATMDKAKSDATMLVQNFEAVAAPQTTTTKYRPGDIDRPAVVPLFGDVLSEDKGARPKQPQTRVTNNKDNQDKIQHSDVRQYKINTNNVRLKSTMTVKNSKYSVRVIVPAENYCIWVAATYDKHLTLVNTNGTLIKESVDVCDGDSYIIDAKMYNGDLLVTCMARHQVIRLSGEGKSTIAFSDMSPYYPYGLCVTYEMDILVCLKFICTKNDNDTKVVRLDRNGKVIQTVQKDYQGAALYSWPSRVTSLLTGEILVSDKDQHMRVLCVNSSGHQMFTWNGKAQKEKVDKFDPSCITHDKYNNVFITDFDNQRVLMLSKDGIEAKCLLDKTHGIYNPFGIAVDSDGQLWVGCTNGNLHLIEYSKEPVP